MEEFAGYTNTADSESSDRDLPSTTRRIPATFHLPRAATQGIDISLRAVQFSVESKQQRCRAKG
jgi:hypothetical protein